MDWNGPSIIQDDDVTINVPNVICPLEAHELAIMQNYFDPHNYNDEGLGVELYLSVRHFVHALLHE